MKVTEFSEATKRDHIPAPWEPLLAPDDFVSYLPTYRGGAYLDLFQEMTTQDDTVGAITSYLYAPQTDAPRPLLVFFHGATNALAGKICVMHSGGELYASPSYQEDMGGAYVLVPLANEKKDENGNLIDSWSPDYFDVLARTILNVKAQHAISKVIVLGGSSGGYMSWAFTEAYPDLVNACVPISSGYVPEKASLQMLAEHGIQVIAAHGRHDELCSFAEYIAPHEADLMAMPNILCYFPEWVRNGDYGVASLNFGFEIGQHCLINQVQANLLYADGKPYDERLPKGVTGWIAAL